MERKVRMKIRFSPWTFHNLYQKKNKKIPLSAENTWTMFFLFLGLKLDLSITIIIFRKTVHVVYGWPLNLVTNDLIFGRHRRRYIWEKKSLKQFTLELQFTFLYSQFCTWFGSSNIVSLSQKQSDFRSIASA